MNSRTFKHQRGKTSSRQTIWLQNKKTKDLRIASKGSKAITSYFPSNSNSASVASSASAASLANTPLNKAIGDLERILKMKTNRPTGQHWTRHCAVLHFMYLQRKQPDKTRAELSRITTNAFNRGKWVAEKIISWEILWKKGRFISDGKQGRFAKISSWFNDEEVRLQCENTLHKLVKVSCLNNNYRLISLTGSRHYLPWSGLCSWSTP